jgi:hypothetical protein
MNKYPVNKFQQWLEDNHNRTIDSLTWQEYNKYEMIYSQETMKERMTAIMESMTKDNAL